MSIIKLELIDSIDAFQTLEPEWNKLLERSNSASVFLSWEWMYTWWDVYGKVNSDLAILLAYKDGVLLGIAPMCVTKKNLLGFFPYRTVHFIGEQKVAADHLDIIVERGREIDICENFINYYLNKTDYDKIEMHSLRHDSSILETIRQWPETDNKYVSIRVGTVCPFIRLPDSWEEYLLGLSRKTRENLRRRIRLILEKLGGELVEVKDLSSVKEIFRKLVEQHQANWTSKEKLGSYGTMKFRLFHERLIEKLFPKGTILFHALKVKKEIIAVYYSFLMGGRLMFYSTGYDKNWEKYSPGTALLGIVIKRAIDLCLSEFDFLRGESNYKYRWTKQSRKDMDVDIWRSRWIKMIEEIRLWLRDRAIFLLKKITPGMIYARMRKANQYRKLR